MTAPRLTEFMGYTALTSAPDEKPAWGHFLATYMDECQEVFEGWLAEYTRQQREEAWEEGYEAALWDKNPYRPETLPFNIHKWAEEVRKAND